MNITAKSLLLLILPLLVTANGAAESNIPSKFSTGDLEMICHPGVPCYPRLFVATDEFQPVKPDQDIPPGLHVRLDVQTGQKEARLYARTDENDPAHEIVLSPDQEEPATPPEHAPAQQAIKPPKSAVGERGLFDASLAALLSKDVTEAALAPLADLVHEAYWGAQLASSPKAVSRLLSLLSPSSSAPSPLRALSALTLGSALSNNPKALSHAATHPLAPAILGALSSESDELCQKRFLFLLGQALRDGGVRKHFLLLRGVETLLRLFLHSSKEVQGRVAVVVEDAFLNLDMRHGSRGGAEGVRELRAALCQPFQDAVVAGEDSRVLSALVALKACEVGAPFRAWAEAYRGGDLDDLVKVFRGGGTARDEL